MIDFLADDLSLQYPLISLAKLGLLSVNSLISKTERPARNVLFICGKRFKNMFHKSSFFFVPKFVLIKTCFITDVLFHPHFKKASFNPIQHSGLLPFSSRSGIPKKADDQVLRGLPGRALRSERERTSGKKPCLKKRWF